MVLLVSTMTDPTQIPKYKLVYFPLRGRGEFIRYMFALAEVPYEEEFVQFNEWPQRKPQLPFQSLPLLEINNGEHVINQSLAIARLLARRFGLAGKNLFEQALADQYVEGWQDIITPYSVMARHILQGDFDSAKEAYGIFKRETLGDYLRRYENFLNINPTHSGWLVGDNVTYADLVVGEFIDKLRHVYDANILDDYPELNRFLTRLNNLPPIKRRIEERRPDWKM